MTSSVVGQKLKDEAQTALLKDLVCTAQ